MMNTICTIETPTHLTTRSMLFVGFENTLQSNILHFPHGESNYIPVLENNPFKVFQWLLKHITKPETAEQSAVFFKSDWLINDRFRLAQQIMGHPTLMRIPLIVLADSNHPLSTEKLMANGIDDCYEAPVKWSALEARLEFLMQYKQKILAQSKQAVQDNFEFKMPLLKRIVDIIGATLGIILSAPIWIPTAIAIRLESSGPVLYRSKRVGTGYHVF